MADPKFLDRKVYYPGQVIFREGEPGERAYLVQKGAVEVYKTSQEGKERSLAEIAEGGIFGEMALVDDQPRMASVRALEETTLVEVNRDTFYAKLTKADPFIRGLLKLFVRNLRNIQK